jgi:hypothetical protein
VDLSDPSRSHDPNWGMSLARLLPSSVLSLEVKEAAELMVLGVTINSTNGQVDPARRSGCCAGGCSTSSD